MAEDLHLDSEVATLLYRSTYPVPALRGLSARGSTEKQATEDRTSLADQMRRNREVCEREGWTVADEYVDPGISGEELERRPELTRLLVDCEAGRIDVVVAIDLDRLARDEYVFAQVFRRLDLADIAVHADGTHYSPDNLSQLLTRGIKAVGHLELLLVDGAADLARAAESFRRLVPPPNIVTGDGADPGAVGPRRH
jgi:hypothetical protein